MEPTTHAVYSYAFIFLAASKSVYVHKGSVQIPFCLPLLVPGKAPSSHSQAPHSGRCPTFTWHMQSDVTMVHFSWALGR